MKYNKEIYFLISDNLNIIAFLIPLLITIIIGWMLVYYYQEHGTIIKVIG